MLPGSTSSDITTSAVNQLVVNGGQPNTCVDVGDVNNCSAQELNDRCDELAKKFARQKVYNDDKYKYLDRSDKKLRKRMDARISEVKQTKYKELLEEVILKLKRSQEETNNYQYTKEIQADLEYMLEKEKQEKIHLNENNSVLLSEYQKLNEKNKMIEAELRDKTLQYSHLDKKYCMIKQKNESTSKTLLDLQNMHSPLLSAIQSRMHHSEYNHHNENTQVTCKVVEDTSFVTNLNDEQQSTTSVGDLYTSPKRSIIHAPNLSETPMKRARKLTLELYISPQLPKQQLVNQQSTPASTAKQLQQQQSQFSDATPQQSNTMKLFELPKSHLNQNGNSYDGIHIPKNSRYDIINDDDEPANLGGVYY